jgi:hypothetical protein
MTPTPQQRADYEAWAKRHGLPQPSKRGWHHYSEAAAEIIALLPFIALFVGIMALVVSAG